MLTYLTVLGLMLFVVLLFIGIGVKYSWGKIHEMDDFLTARGNTGTGMLSATLLASFLGVFALFTPPETGVIGGLIAVIGYALGVGSLFLAFSVLSPRIRDYLPQGSTLTDYVWKRYGAKMYGLTLIISVFYMIVHLVAELTSIALVAYQLAEIPLLYTALIIGFGTMIYTAYGGLKASILTDTIQMVLVIILLGVLTIGIMYFGGGIEEVFSKVSANSPQLISFTNLSGLEYGLTLCIAVFAANLFHQGYWQRIYSGKDNKTISKSLTIAICMVIPIMILTGFLGVVASSFGAASNPSTALFTLAYSMFPKSLIIAIFVLALVLVMSTVDTLLNAMVATFTVDGKRIVKSLKPKSLLSIARLFTVILIIPAILIAAKGYSILYLFLVADLVCAGAFFPLFYGLFNQKCKENTAFIASLLGIVSGVPFFIGNKLLLAFVIPVVVSASICIIATKFQKKEIHV